MISHNVGDSWDGDAQHAMGGPHAAVTLPKRRDDDLVNVKVVNAVGRRDDIDDGVNGTHLMEVDFLDGNAVRLCLCLGNDVKDAMGQLARTRGERACVDDGFDLNGTAMLVVMVVPVTMVIVVMVRVIVIMFVIVFVFVMMVVLVLMMVRVIMVMVMVMAMLVHMLMAMLVMVVILMLVVMLVLLRLVEVAVEPLHVMVVTVMLGIEHHVKVADIERRYVASRDLDLKARDAQAIQCLPQALLVRAGVK